MRTKFYSTAAWKRLRAKHLARESVCQFCLAIGRTNAVDLVVDHIDPHRGDREKFYDPRNLQTLCKHCHDSRKRMKDVSGYDPQIGVDGWPIDDEHPFNTGKERRKTFLHRGVPIGVKRRGHKTVVVCGPPGAGKAAYAHAQAEGHNGLVLNPSVTAKRLGVDKRPQGSRYHRRKIAEAEIMALNAHDGPAWIIRELPDRSQRLAWCDALEDANAVVMLAEREADCVRRLETEGRMRGGMVERIRSWWRVYERAHGQRSQGG